MAENENKVEINTDDVQKKAREWIESVRKISKGIYSLSVPIRAGGTDVTELIYDLSNLNGFEYADAMDSDPKASPFKISMRQAIALFAKSAAKCTDKVDEQDIIARVSAQDAIGCAQVAMSFFRLYSNLGGSPILKD